MCLGTCLIDLSERGRGCWYEILPFSYTNLFFFPVYVNDNAIFFVVDVIGHIVEKDSIGETEKGKFVLEAKVISGSNIGEKVFIPMLSLSPSDVKIPFKFQKRQFTIFVSFAMTINKSQAQSLKNVGIYMSSPVFSHGQLYVAISRVTSK